MGVREKIAAGDYKYKGEWPVKPVRPNILNQLAGSLATEELANVARIRDEYEAALNRWSVQTEQCKVDQAKLENQFRTELFVEAGVEDNELGSLLYSQAYEHGHSGGMGEVAGYFLDNGVRVWEVVQRYYQPKRKKAN